MARTTQQEQLAQWQNELVRAKRWRRDQGLDDLWHRMAKTYSGEFLPSAKDDEQRIQINLAFSTVNVIYPSVSLNYPKIGVVSNHPENEDRAVFHEQILNYFWKHYDFQEPFRESVKDMVIYGFGFTKVGWLYSEIEQELSVEEHEAQALELGAQAQQAATANPTIAADLPTPDEIRDNIPRTRTVPIEDRPFVERISPFDIYVNPEATSMNDLRWVAQRIVRRREDVMDDDNYQANARKEVQGGFTEVESMDPRFKEHDTYMASEWVVVWEFYDVANRKMGVFSETGSKWLVKPRGMPYAYGHPFEMVRNYDVPEHFYPIGDVEMIEDLVHEISHTRSEMMNYRAGYARKYLYRDGAIDRQNVHMLTDKRDGLAIPVSDTEVDLQNVVAALPQTSLDASLFQWSEQITNDINEVSGVSEFARGQSPPTRQTATEAALIQDAQNARSKEKLARVERYISSIAGKVMQITQQFLTGQHYVRITGPGTEAFYAPYTREDIRGEFDYTVEAGSTEPSNESTRRQNAIQMMNIVAPFIELGIVDPVPVLTQVLQDGFGIRNATKFMTPQAKQIVEMLQQQALAGGQAGPGQQQPAAQGPNGVGREQPSPEQRRDDVTHANMRGDG